MAASLGSITLNLHLTTSVGGPILLGEAELDVPVHAVPGSGDSAALVVDTAVLRHEIAAALIVAAQKIEAGEDAEDRG